MELHCQHEACSARVAPADILFESGAQVKHEGEGVRVVLLMNFWHPDLPRDKWGPIAPQSRYAMA